MCATTYFGDKLVEAVRAGQVDESCIDEAAVRIVRTLLAFQAAREQAPEQPGEDPAALALETACKGITLLKNRDVLPFDSTRVRTLAVIGRLAAQPNLGDHGSSRVYPPYAITPLEGLARTVPEVELLYADGSDPTAAEQALRQADAAVFVLGFDFDDEGEYTSEDQDKNYTNATGGDRRYGLGLHRDEKELITALGGISPNTAVVLIGGSTITMEGWEEIVPAILHAYYPGQEGGRALAQILFGQVNPSGRLPFVVPRRDEDLPAVEWVTRHQYYDYYHGYQKLDKEGVEPLFPYGFGLSYTEFVQSDPEFVRQDGQILARCTVTNRGARAGEQVIQLYAGFAHSQVERPVKKLCGFCRVSLQPGESRRVEIACPLDRLAWYDPRRGAFRVEAMPYELYIGSSSRPADLLAGSVTVEKEEKGDAL